MSKRKSARKKAPGKVVKRPVVVVPAADDASLFEGKAEPLDVDVAAHLRWLETGEGEPWPPASSS